MRALIVKPTVFMYETFQQFADDFKIDDNDLIFTHEFIYLAFFKPLELKCHFVFQEKFGVSEPSDTMVNEILKEIKKFKFGRVIAVGGGTVIDIGKLLSLQKPDDILDLYEGRMAPKKECELILIPTTCGTGSEVTNISILGITYRHVKQGLANDEMYADKAILIPELYRELPLKIFMHSSIDALIHAAESYLSSRSSEFTELFARKAIEKIIGGYRAMVEKGTDHRKEIIKEFVLGSNYAGIAFGNTGVGAVHALSMTFGGAYHIPHGEANYEFFTTVFKEYRRKNPQGKIRQLDEIVAGALGCDSNDDVYTCLENVLNSLIMRKPLREYGMKHDECAFFAETTIASQQRLLVNNYVPLSKEELTKMFADLY
jgi:4-hydroxybutyrate dehydrogenase